MFSRSLRSALVDFRLAAPSTFIRNAIAAPAQRTWLSTTTNPMNQNDTQQQKATSQSQTPPAAPATATSTEDATMPRIPNQMSVDMTSGQHPGALWQAEHGGPMPSLETTIDANVDADFYKLPVPPKFDSPLEITKKTAELLPYLTTQAQHQASCYVAAHIHARPYLLTQGDTLRLPFLMPGVEPGDIIRLNRASVLGSRDFMLKGTPYVDERMFECRMCVLGTESEPLRIKEKTKRRQRHVRHVKSKHKYTVMKVKELRIKTLEELVAEGAKLIDE